MKKLKKKIFLFSGENLTMPKKTERRNPLGFSNIHSVAKHQKKCRGDPLRKKNFEKKIRKKCLAVPKKNERGDSLVSPGMICYAEKQVNSFWSSSLGQMVLFDTIIFCRTFKNYFGQFVWIEKKKKKKSHYNSRVSLHEAPTKKRPMGKLQIFFIFTIFAYMVSFYKFHLSLDKVNCPVDIDESIHRIWNFTRKHAKNHNF